VIDAVASTPGAIGFVEERSITDRVSVVKVDGKLPDGVRVFAALADHPH